jgi:cystathionine beta-lyase
MSYDFDTPIERRGTHAVKWDYEPIARHRGEQPEMLPMWVADMDLPCPQEVVDALRERAAHPIYGYTMVPDSLLDAFRSWHERRHGTRIVREEIVTVTGVMPAVEAAIAHFTEPGDGVVIQTPVYFPFYDAISKQGRTLVRNPLIEEEGSYRIDVDGLRAALREGAKMLLLCSPHNPVGRVWSRKELAEMAQICLEEGALLLSDEIHCDILLGDSTFTSVLSLGEEVREHTIVATSPSKTFNIAGNSCAQTVVPSAEHRKTFKRAVMSRGIWMPNLFGVVATEAAYRHGETWLNELLSYLSATDAAVREELSRVIQTEAPVRMSPLEGTYIAWLDFRGILSETGKSHAELRKALEEAAVWPSDGTLFGEEGEGFQRINIAAPRDLVLEGVRRIGRAVDALSR